MSSDYSNQQNNGGIGAGGAGGSGDNGNGGGGDAGGDLASQLAGGGAESEFVVAEEKNDARR